MKTAGTAFVAVMVISSLGIWGCAQQKSGVQTNKIRDLEARYTKLEEDYRSLLAASDSTRKKMSQMELQRAELLQQVEDLKVVAAEREDLRHRLNTRTVERDAMQSHLVQFSKDLSTLALRVETAATSGMGSTFTALPVSRKSN